MADSGAVFGVCSGVCGLLPGLHQACYRCRRAIELCRNAVSHESPKRACCMLAGHNCRYLVTDARLISSNHARLRSQAAASGRCGCEHAEIKGLHACAGSKIVQCADQKPAGIAYTGRCQQALPCQAVGGWSICRLMNVRGAGAAADN